MEKKRTNIDFKDHELLITKNETATIYHLKKPDTYYDSIKYINIQGILAVTGDYSNWMFCREFHPTAEPNNCASDGYWREKLQISSTQEPLEFDSDKTTEAINEMLADEEAEYSEEIKTYLNELLSFVYDDIEYKYHAYREMPDGMDYEYVPYEKSYKYHFLAVLDGFDEMCKRMRVQ